MSPGRGGFPSGAPTARITGMDQHPDLVVDAAPAWDRPLVTVPTFALFALVGGLFKSFSVAANLYVLILGGLLMWVGLSATSVKRPSPVRLGRAARWWLIPASIFVIAEVINFALGSTYDHPTLSILVADPLASYPIRSLTYFAWLGGFWGLVRR